MKDTIDNVDEFYKEWIKKTKRNGGVLIGSSIKELLRDFEQRQAPQQLPVDYEAIELLKEVIKWDGAAI